MNDYISHAHHRTLLHKNAGDYVSHHRPRPVRIEDVHARQILDSRGNPTLTVRLTLEDGTVIQASAPAGASTGAHEAVERRDGLDAYRGKGVTEAVSVVNGAIRDLITGRTWTSIREVDDALRQLDGSEDLRRLGANSVVATSIAMTRAFAHTAETPFTSGWHTSPGQRHSCPYPTSTCSTAVRTPPTNLHSRNS